MTKRAWNNIQKRKTRKPSAREEDSLSFMVAAWLELALRGTGVAWTHFPAGEKRTAATGAKLKKMGLHPGWPDYFFLIRMKIGFTVATVFIGIDLKSKTGTQSQTQKDVQAEIEAAGGYYYLARSIAEVAGYLKGHGVDLRARAV
ncbi:MAG: hypothetical protein COB36_11515 [Alphaproteobacteria bacterium]|nr:MAG: hypothetical protein COB36_11515 [Alphaproteobacteria bacterium]